MRASARKAKEQAPPKRSAAGVGPNGKDPARSGGKDAAGGKRKKSQKTSRQELGLQAAQELLKLRPIFKEVGTTLLDRLDGELAGLARALDGGGMPGETPVLPPARILTSMLADITALKVKPTKGRVKDLRRIEALLKSVSARIPSGA